MDSENYSMNDNRKRKAEENRKANIFERSRNVCRTPKTKRNQDKVDTIMNIILEMKPDLKKEINQVTIE